MVSIAIQLYGLINMIEIGIGLCSCYKSPVMIFMAEVILDLFGHYCWKDDKIYLCRGSEDEFVDIVINHETLHYLLRQIGLSYEDNQKFDKLFKSATVCNREGCLRYMDEYGVPVPK